MKHVSGSSLALGIFLIVVTGWLLVSDAGAVEPRCPGGASPDPNVIVCYDFETGTAYPTWSPGAWCCDTNGDGILTTAEMDFVICGSKGFQSNCAAWTNGYKYGNQFAQTTILSLGFSEIYARWYAYVSNPFNWDPTGDKNFMLRDPAGGSFDPYVLTNLWGTGKPHVIIYNNSGTPCVNQSTPSPNGEYTACVNRTQNMGNDLVLQPGRWYLFEWYVKLNTPGAANGVTKLWVDDASGPIATQTLRASYTDVVFRTTGDGWRLLTDIMLTAYANTRVTNALPDQYTKWDQIVFSRARIGPIGSDSNPPQPPTGLTVR
jgi:hypothetical protein